MNVADLIAAYQADPDSRFHKLRYGPRLTAIRACRIIAGENGDVTLADIQARQILRWYEEWSRRGIAMAHGLVGRLRTVIGFGADLLDDPHDRAECERIAAILHRQRFKMGKPRTEALTAEQAIAVRRMAHAIGRHSIALAQAFQFELMLRQKDVIGEWIPQTEPGSSDLFRGDLKWLCGLRWEEIDAGLILRHTTSKREKEIVVDLKLSPMVMEELRDLGELPTTGPVIVSETTNWPYEAPQFRSSWRKIARMAGIPDEVFNMDSRAGGITEALLAGAPLDAVRKSATHSDSSMTQKYSRNDVEAGADVQRLRNERRASRSQE